MRKLSKQIGVRVTPELYELLKRVVDARGEDASGFARRAILKELATLSFLSEERKKALGVSK